MSPSAASSNRQLATTTPRTAGMLAEREPLTLDSIALATGHTPAEVVLIAGTVDKSTPLEELLLYIARADAMRLNPLLRQCYLIPRAGKFVLQTGIDGYRLQAARSRCYAGSDDAVFRGTVTIEGTNKTAPESCSVTVWRSEGGRKHPFSATVFWSEYYPGAGPIGDVWRSRPRGQLAKCAEALALRKGFPAELAGLEQLPMEGDDEPAPADEQPRRQRTVQENAELHARIFDGEDRAPAPTKRQRPLQELVEHYKARLHDAFGSGLIPEDDLEQWTLPENATREVVLEAGLRLADLQKLAAEKPADVTVRSTEGQRLADLVEEAARLDVEFDDCRVVLPAPYEQVIRASEKLYDRVEAKKRQLAGLDQEPHGESQDDPAAQQALV